ncbi:AAA family ATPase [Breznakiella homolactica]|uniref:MoxR family ATPase n=1 Tax=Breznakiella homolactica TaxID=2798577 RepID=A0A7T7XM88_9SPIR|nr:MoxR family ATPase [Breznakiella homolactica]QQO08955.1 MoxR family ATPase [Breznakiella homolactica]
MDQEETGTGKIPADVSTLLDSCRSELAKRIVGQQEMVNGLLMALIAGGHVLLEGVPGLAKTLAVKSLAELTGLDFKRIQFTPDLLPADLTGTLIWEQARGAFSVRRGPVFANLILADEINRAPAKVQSALLEAMEEHQVTIGEQSYPLPEPFFVLATQNPIEHEGTYALPEAELDRFLLKLLVKYPSPEEELRILKFGKNISASGHTRMEPIRPILDGKYLAMLRSAAEAVRTDEQIQKYIVSVVSATRPGEDSKKGSRDDLYRFISFGASPRATLALYRCSRIAALFEGRTFVTPGDVKAVTLPVLRHRIVLSYEAEAEGLDADGVISRILSFIPVP